MNPVHDAALRTIARLKSRRQVPDPVVAAAPAPVQAHLGSGTAARDDEARSLHEELVDRCLALDLGVQDLERTLAIDHHGIDGSGWIIDDDPDLRDYLDGLDEAALRQWAHNRTYDLDRATTNVSLGHDIDYDVDYDDDGDVER